MKNLSVVLLALLLVLNMACQKDDDVAPVSEQKKQLMTEKWAINQVDAVVDYVMKSSFGDVPVKQTQSLAGLSAKCEYAATMRFAEGDVVAIAYLPGFCGQQSPAANNIKWSANNEVTELTLIGENLAGFSLDIKGNHLSNGNKAVFTVKELTSQKLVIERTIPITDFFSQDAIALFASQGVTLNGTYSYKTTYIAK